MDSSHPVAPPPTTAERPLDITPPEVWASLTLNQQNYLLQTVARICQETLLPVPMTQEAGHE
jgi:hypothetical protein